MTARAGSGEETWTALQLARTGPQIAEIPQPDPALPDRFTSDGTLLVQWNADRTWANELHSGRQLWSVNAAPAFPARPLLRRDAVLLPGGDGRVRRLDRLNGKESWATEVSRGRPIGALATDTDQLYAGTPDGMVMALDLKRGGVRWASQLGERLISGPVVLAAAAGSATVWFGVAPGRLVGLDSDSGAERADLGLTRNATQLLASGPRLVAVTEAETSAFSHDGKRLWTARVTGTTAADDAVVASAGAGSLVLLDAASGAELKRVAVPVGIGPDVMRAPSLVLGARAIYASLGDGEVRAVDRTSGRVQWSLPVPGGVQQLARVRGQVLVLDGESRLQLVTEP